MPICSGCKMDCVSSNCHSLLTGKIICGNCLSKDTVLSTKQISEYNNKIHILKNELSLLRSGFFSCFFNGNKIKEVEYNISHIEENINREKRNIVTQNRLCEILIDYPPDWGIRREIVLRDAKEKCTKCGSSYNLHVHHIIRLAQGGSNHLSNLIALCAQCHSKTHGGKRLDNAKNNSELALSKRLKDIETAISNDRNISFGYKKKDEESFTRRKIKPNSIVSKERQDGSISICVKGYCYTRKEQRQFALSKMERVSILKT